MSLISGKKIYQNSFLNYRVKKLLIYLDKLKEIKILMIKINYYLKDNSFIPFQNGITKIIKIRKMKLLKMFSQNNNNNNESISINCNNSNINI